MQRDTKPHAHYTWRRILWDGIAVLVVLLLLEAVVRVPPVQSRLAWLDSYENLLWYDSPMPILTHDLERNDYNLWLVGSSYMQTAMNPRVMQDILQTQGFADVSVQNLGLSRLTNLDILAQVFDRHFLEIDTPPYMVLFLAEPNFGRPTAAQVLQGTYESLFLFPDSVDDYTIGFLYQNSDLFRYLLLARNVPSVAKVDTMRDPRPLGSFVEREGMLSCADVARDVLRVDDHQHWFDTNIDKLDSFIAMTQARDIQLLIVHLPLPDCTRAVNYTNFADYQLRHLQPLEQHITQQGIPFVELDTRFEATIPPSEQYRYFDDAVHVNQAGAALLVEWASNAIAAWLD